MNQYDTIKIGDSVIDTHNEFGHPHFKFINGQSYDPKMCLCKVMDKTDSSICISLNKLPLRIVKKDGGLTNPVASTQWFRFKRDHDQETTFEQRFKVIIP